MTDSLQDTLCKARARLQHLTDSPQREACLLMAHALKTTYENIYFEKDRLLTRQEELAFQALLQRRLNHEPLSKIKEYREFWSLPFRVTADTLDPRPDSETLIQTVIDHNPDKTREFTILDLGTGTGCLLLSLLREYPNASGVGIDFSEAAALIAQENANKLGLTSRASFVVGNWTDAIMAPFSVIISNPPYIRHQETLAEEVSRYDPHSALFAGQDGLDCYRKLPKLIKGLCTADTKVFLELGPDQLEDVTALFSSYTLIATADDLSKRKRCAVFQLNFLSDDF
jgi:release factor glutamine methyltransferase